MSSVIVPIVLGGVLPVLIVGITSYKNINQDNKRAQVLIKAMEANNDIDADKLAQALSKPPKSAREILNSRLLRGCIYSFLGIALTLVCAIVCHNGMDIESDTAWISLLGGMASLAVGISYLIVYFVTRRQV